MHESDAVLEMWDEYDLLHDTWIRRVRWVAACKPPRWRIFKYRRWQELYTYVNAPLVAWYRRRANV